jgi:RNA polymerase sigma-70 factor (ECF subfamily)
LNEKESVPGWKNGRWPRNDTEFERMVEAMHVPLIQYAFRILGSREDAEDIVQQVLVKAYSLGNGNGQIQNAQSYLFRMARNASYNFNRGRRIETEPIHETTGNGLENENTNTNESESLAEIYRINKLLAALPGDQAEVIRLKLYDELSFSQIGDMLEITTSTAKSRFRYGLEKLQRNLSDEKELLT